MSNTCAEVERAAREVIAGSSENCRDCDLKITPIRSTYFSLLCKERERKGEKEHLHLSLSTAFATHMSIAAVPTPCVIVFRTENKKIKEKRQKIAIASELFAPTFFSFSPSILA